MEHESQGLSDAIVHAAFLAMGTERRQSARNRFDHERNQVEAHRDPLDLT